MTTFVRTFIAIFALLSAILVFSIFAGILMNFFEKKAKSNIFSNSYGDPELTNKIAVLNLRGPILNIPISDFNFVFSNNLEIIYTSEVKKILNELKSKKIKGLIVSINSPGGSVSASHNLFKQFENFKRKNDVKIYFHTSELIASGAYWVALSGNKIYADYGTLVGSIGVKGPDWMYFEDPISISTGLIGYSIKTKSGIKNFSNIAGESKDLFNPFRKPTEKEIKDLQQSVNNIYEDFVNLVSKNRKIEKTFIINDIRAMIYDSKTAEKKFLIDKISTKEEVIEIMANDLNLIDYQVIENKNYKLNFFDKLLNINFSNDKIKEIKNIQKENVCKILHFEFSAMIINNNYIPNC